MNTADEYIHQVTHLIPPGTPLRSQIALELRGHIAERVAAGDPIDEALRRLGEPAALAQSYLDAVPLANAPFWRRAAAKILDLIAIALIVVPSVWVAVRSNLGELFTFAILGVVLGGALLLAAYTAAAERFRGQTLGKYLMGIRVVRESGAQISAGQSVVRQLPMFLQFYYVDVLFALFTERNQRAFELLSKTRVVLAAPRQA